MVAIFMKRVMWLLLAAVILVPATGFAKTKTTTDQADTAIILTLFGSSEPAVERSVSAFRAAVQAAFPQHKVLVAYTANRAREALRARGKEAPSVAQALASLPEAGLYKAVVQSLHIMPGYEYSDSQSVARAMEGLPKGLKSVRMGAPLISNAQALDDVSTALLASLPPREADAAVLFVGHGTDHMGGLAYPALQYALWQHDARAFVSTLGGAKFEGSPVPSTQQSIEALHKAQVKKVYLTPLMTVAGVHVKDDIVGADDASVTSQLKKQGFTVQEVRKGLLDMPAVQKIFIARIQQALIK